jgi:zeta-carotene desaturase
MPQVTVIGAGIAGLAAALRLLERGFDVTLFEQDDFLGGKLGAHNHTRYKADYHEHSFHMYLNWYHNFWEIVDDLGIRRHFKAQPAMTYLKRNHHAVDGHQAELINVGAIGSAWHNLFSGVQSPADMFLYGYSLVDLLGSSVWPLANLSRTSVFDFLESRPYLTDGAMALHGQTLAKAFASPTYLSDAQSYRQFIGYGFRQPDPMMWLLRGNTRQCLFEPFERHLEKLAAAHGTVLRIEKLQRVDKLELEQDKLGKNGKVTGLWVSTLPSSPTIDVDRKQDGDGARFEALSGDVILAVPPQALSKLVDAEMFNTAPELGYVRKLRSQPMASLDVYFKRRLRNVPAPITLCLDSPFGLTFLDTSQLWSEGSPEVTYLNLTMSDYRIFAPYKSSDEVAKIKEYMFGELRHYIEFHYDPVGKDDDIDRDRSHLQTNVGEELFTNEVGSWEFRPETTCKIPNLLIAGDYCKTFVNVVTIESAVVSGLLAAEAVRKRASVGDPIRVITPDVYPEPALAALKLVGMPYAYAAKGWSMLYGALQPAVREIFPNG